MRWNYLSTPKPQRLLSFKFGDRLVISSHPALYWACHYFSILRLKLIHVSKRVPWAKIKDREIIEILAHTLRSYWGFESLYIVMRVRSYIIMYDIWKMVVWNWYHKYYSLYKHWSNPSVSPRKEQWHRLWISKLCIAHSITRNLGDVDIDGKCRSSRTSVSYLDR